MNLYSANKKNTYLVTYVPEIGLLKNLGIRVGTKIAVRQRYAFGGPILLNIEDSFFVAIGKDIATQIRVGALS
jgi:Fe2+ transport system protein FeoA